MAKTSDETTLAKIEAAALRILADEGPERVSMRRVAALVGITPMAIYHYFADRETLLIHVTDKEFARLAEFFDAHWKRDSKRDRFVTMLDGYVAYAFAAPRVFDYVFSRPRPGARRYPEDFRAGRSPTLSPVAEAIAAGMRAGEIAKGDPWELAFQCWAMVHGYVGLHRAGRVNLHEADFKALVHRAMARLLKGMKPR